MDDLLGLSRDILKKGRSVRFQAKGWSMHPFVQDGDFITVSPVEDSSIKTGDVVFYSTAEDRIIVHRVIRKYQKDGRVTMLIKGDATSGPSEKVNAENILGKVVAIERDGQKKRLDTKIYRMKSLVLAGISPFSRWTYLVGRMIKHNGLRVLRKILQGLQGLKPYRILIKRLIRKDNISYQIATSDDAFSLSRFYSYHKYPEIENPVKTFEDQLKELQGSGYCLVAKKGDKVIGSTTIARSEDTDSSFPDWWLTGMLVNWRYRGMGIGERLTKMACEIAAENGASNVKLLAFKKSRPAINLYRKMGFRQISIPQLDEQLKEEARKTSRRRIILAKDVNKDSSFSILP